MDNNSKKCLSRKQIWETN